MLRLCYLLCLWGMILPPMMASTPTPDAESPCFRILVFSKTEGYRHASIPTGVGALEKLGRENGFAVDHTEDATQFTFEHLRDYRAVVFLSTTGNVLDAAQQDAFERYIRQGGGYVGIHSASDTEYDWPWYGELVGAWFRDHPKIQQANIVRLDAEDISTAPLPDTWTRTDEWYNFRQAPDPEQVHFLLRLDESTYEGGNMGDFHPVSWRHDFDGGRAWYTALGHTEESYAEPLFLAHVLGGIRYAAGYAAAYQP